PTSPEKLYRVEQEQIATSYSILVDQMKALSRFDAVSPEGEYSGCVRRGNEFIALQYRQQNGDFKNSIDVWLMTTKAELDPTSLAPTITQIPEQQGVRSLRDPEAQAALAGYTHYTLREANGLLVCIEEDREGLIKQSRCALKGKKFAPGQTTWAQVSEEQQSIHKVEQGIFPLLAQFCTEEMFPTQTGKEMFRSMKNIRPDDRYTPPSLAEVESTINQWIQSPEKWRNTHLSFYAQLKQNPDDVEVLAKIQNLKEEDELLRNARQKLSAFPEKKITAPLKYVPLPIASSENELVERRSIALENLHQIKTQLEAEIPRDYYSPKGIAQTLRQLSDGGYLMTTIHDEKSRKPNSLEITLLYPDPAKSTQSEGVTTDLIYWLELNTVHEIGYYQHRYSRFPLQILTESVKDRCTSGLSVEFSFDSFYNNQISLDVSAWGLRQQIPIKNLSWENEKADFAGSIFKWTPQNIAFILELCSFIQSSDADTTNRTLWPVPPSERVRSSLLPEHVLKQLTKQYEHEKDRYMYGLPLHKIESMEDIPKIEAKLARLKLIGPGLLFEYESALKEKDEMPPGQMLKWSKKYQQLRTRLSEAFGLDFDTIFTREELEKEVRKKLKP
ncbi:hypothetical protein HGB07_05850, partial [Candidatus Roizmanbacteria bacterium]|nr:hypothetical protein [Candidatus Roizmanbacteria bacterium]